MVTGSKEQAALFELADGGDIGADLIMYEFESPIDALEYGNEELQNNMKTCSINLTSNGAYRRKVARSIIEAASEADTSYSIAALQEARKVLKDMQK